MSELTEAETRQIFATVQWARLGIEVESVASDITEQVNAIIAARVEAARADERERCANRLGELARVRYPDAAGGGA
jgi:outer membrane murein-binding lipoprotein Lpp